jgi:hypothetical protein
MMPSLKSSCVTYNSKQEKGENLYLNNEKMTPVHLGCKQCVAL